MAPPDLVRTGPVVQPPPPPPPPPETPRSVAVEPDPGESLNAVGERYGVPAEQMQAANPDVAAADQPLPAQAQVRLPVGDGPGQVGLHPVASGESLADIARAAGIDEAALRGANRLGPGQAVYPGTVLILPAGGPSSKPGDPDPTSTDALVEAFPSLQQYPPGKLEQISRNAQALRDGDFAERLAAVAELARDLQPAELQTLLKDLGVADQAVVKLVTDTKALGAVSTLADPKASATDRIAAALTLTDSIGALAPGELGRALQPYLAALPAGAKLADAIGTYLDPDASALDKAEATLALAGAVKDAAGTAFPDLAQRLRATDSFSRTIAAGLTLLDPDASLEDKAKAAVELAVNVPDLAGDAGRIADFLRGAGVPDADAIQAAIDRLPAASLLSPDVRAHIAPDVAAGLDRAQVEQLNRLAANPELQGDLGKLLSELKDPAAARALLASLDGAADDDARKALLGALSGLREGTADAVLTLDVDGKPASEVLAKLANELGPEGRAGLAKLVKDFDADAIKVLLRMADKVDAGVLEGVLKLGLDSKTAASALKALDNVLGKAGVALTGDVAARVLKGVAKVVPIAGAAPAAYSAVELGAIAADPSLPPDIRFLALQGTKLNGVDAVLSVAEPFIAEFFGIPVVADVALGIAELGIELIVHDQKAKYEADPSGYRAPDWLTTLNVAIAGSSGAQGVAELALIYGPEGAEQAIGAAVRSGGTLAIDVAKAQQIAQANLAGGGLHYTAEGLHLLADVLRNPGKYGEAAVALGQEAVRQLAELGEAGMQVLGEVVDDLRQLGADGVRALGWIASHPGEAAEAAAKALGDLASEAIRLGTQAGEAIAAAALSALGQAKDALVAAGHAVGEAVAAVDRAVRGAVDTALSLGRQGLETLGWIATHPGEAATIAKDALVDIASKGGELARAAYEEIVHLGEAGIEAAKQVARNLVEAGEAGLEMLKYVVRNPGKAAEEVRRIALDGLQRLAEGAGELAESAARELASLVDEGFAQARETVKTLLMNGGAAAETIAEAWSENLSEGAKEVIDGLKDVGGALADNAKKALETLSNAGIGFARDALHVLTFGLL